MIYGYISAITGLTQMFDMGKISNFSIVSDISEITPKGTLYIEDRDGAIYSKMSGMGLGQIINISILKEQERESSTPESAIDFCNLYTTSIENTITNPASLSGVIKISFNHSFGTLLDSEPHAYAPMKISELIKKVLKQEVRGEVYTLNNDFFDKSDDDGKVARYKGCISDYDFITKNLLPYCTINYNPAYLFCTDKGDFKLKSFINMYTEKPKMMFMPPSESSTNTKLLNKVLAKKEQLGTEYLFSFDSAFLKIGDQSIIHEIVPKFSTENVSNGTFVSGKKIPGNKLKETQDSTTFGNIMPVDPTILARVDSTTAKSSKHRNLTDSLAMLFSGSRALDKMFIFGMETDFVGEYLSIGETIDVTLDTIEYATNGDRPKGDYNHWAEDKWVVVRIEHFLDPDRRNRIVSRIYAARPCFVGDRNTTSIQNISSFLQTV